ncbi:hypothetical protein GCM10011289_05940 [Paludibacterium paludis]|uniref:Uncharacterized protein n=1 Tax=Paludibacterium paludis TaxID=1225769 RepID=A0A918NYW9_9NEIS|nr:hypothetical protein GCM10011289_05940 [Paludibacterium paludis]
MAIAQQAVREGGLERGDGVGSGHGSLKSGAFVKAEVYHCPAGYFLGYRELEGYTGIMGDRVRPLP